ncbi:hypothetical protein TRE132_20740 [Pseudomonas chlororaphis subsp. aurantiaca]|nr:hypothetical protein TRE132_20740 [Pseudomonas chlororaphis subsp. aurantiaca]
MKIEQENTQSMPALLRNACGVDAQETKSLCCEAAGIIDPASATAEALIPHEKLREAASVDAALIAQERPPAQPVMGYKPLSQLDERAEYEKEFPVPEGLQYCANRDTYIRAAGSSPSDKFAREHYAYRAGFAAWMRRAWKQATISFVTDSDEIELCYEHALKALESETDTLRTKLTKACQVGIEKSQEAKAYFALLKRITGNNNQDSLRAIAEAAILLASSEPCAHEFIPFTKSCSKCDEPYHQPLANDASVAAIRFALEASSDFDGMDFLRYWNEGDFDSVRESWPEAPEEVFIGADPLYRPDNAQEASE